MMDPCDDPDFEATKAAIAVGLAEADRGETMTLAEAKARTIATLIRTAEERAAKAE